MSHEELAREIQRIAAATEEMRLQTLGLRDALAEMGDKIDLLANALIASFEPEDPAAIVATVAERTHAVTLARILGKDLPEEWTR